MYSKLTIDHFLHPQNVGAMPDADAAAQCINPDCGDVAQIFIKVTDGVLSEVTFLAQGCGAAVACASMTTLLAKGKSPQEARKIDRETVANALGGIPPSKVRCSLIAPDALQAALKDYLQRHPGR